MPHFEKMLYDNAQLLELLALAHSRSKNGVASLADARSGNPRLQQRMPPLLPNLGHQIDEQRIVVEHLLEMRHQPALVHRIAREAAAQMVVNAALAHPCESKRGGSEEAAVSGAGASAP